MDNHPIPQDVTGFQFKLIGNMTVKQFTYLAVGVVMAWIILQLPVSILIKFPFSLFSAILGPGLAFLPISGRPMDLMIGNYIKTLLRPTQFIYEKTGGQIYYSHRTSIVTARSVREYGNAISPFPKDKLKDYIEYLDVQSKNKIDEKENDFLASVAHLASNASSYQSTITSSPKPPQVNPKILSDMPPAKEPVAAKQPDLAGTESDSAGAKFDLDGGSVTAPTPIPALAQTETPQAKTVQAPKNNKSMGLLSIPDSPNLITGITKDPRSNALPNILVEVRDKDSNPVRAFKTNELGRFASATPLINGTYTIEFEDPKGQNKFEKMIINVVGRIILPIEAISIDTREELRRSLFPTNKDTN